MGAGAAARQVGLAAALVEHDRTRRALASGVIDPERAQVITAALDGLSDRVGEQDRGQLEARLLAQAGRLDLGRLRRLALVEAARVDPAGSGDLAGPERAARAGRELTVWRGTDGMHHLGGRLDTAAAATLAAALDPLAAPAPSTVNGPDPRGPGRRRADALVELARRALAAGRLPVSGGVRPQVVVTMSVDQLRARIHEPAPGRAAARGEGCALIAGSSVREPISAAAAGQIACDAALIPAVLGGAQPAAGPGPGRAHRHRRPTPRPGTTRPRLHRPGLRPAPRMVPGPPHRALEPGRGHRPEHPDPGLRPHHDMAHHDGWTITINPTDGVSWHPPPQPPPEPPW